MKQWLAQPCATVVHPTYRHAAIMRDLLCAAGVGGNRVSDAHLAALAIEHGAVLCSRHCRRNLGYLDFKELQKVGLSIRA